MSFYDDASLVVIPSAQKTSKLYAVKPTDGSGDLAFTRTGDTATRVNSAALIEKVRTNLVTRSQEFDNAAWTKDRTTVTANATTAPDGTTTADKVVDTLQGANAYRIYNGVTLSAISYSASFYVKAAEYSWVYIRIGNSLRVWFNVSTGVVGNNDTGITGTIQSAGNGWYRCTAIIATATAGGGFSLLGLTNANGIETYTPSTGGQGVFVWGAQLETTDFGATPYILTTSAAVSVGPVANVPRLDYTGSTCPRLLLEPQRTNLVTYSEQFNNAAWSKDAVSVSANASTSPDGYSNADSIVENSATAFHFVQQTFTLTAVSTTYSIFAKLGSGTRTLILREGVNTGAFAAFNLSTGVVAAQSGGTATITQYGNGFYRCTLTFTAVAGTASMQIALSNANSFASYTGNGTSSIIVYGAQVEGSNSGYATSYIPTLAASATRGADACSKTGISSLIGQTEGTLFVEAILTHNSASNEYLIQVRADNANRFFIYREANTNKIACFALVGGSSIYTQLTAAAVTGTVKAAFAYKSGSFAFYVNGVQVGTSAATYTLAATLSQFFIDQNNGLEFAYDTYKQAILFPTRLTNAQLAELTTL